MALYDKIFKPKVYTLENGKKIEFVSVVDMLNYMSRRGWELNKTYVVQNVIRFLFRN